jgi:hypothetical protein
MRLLGSARLPASLLVCLLVTFAFATAASADRGPSDPAPAPETTLDLKPPPLTSLLSATFAFHADLLGATFECQIDGGASLPCTSPLVIPVLALGSHIFAVRAVGDPTPAVFGWEILALPDTIKDAGPDPDVPTTAGTATFAFHADVAPASFQCALDEDVYENAWVPCASGYEVSSLSIGAHQLFVRALNAAGDPDPEPAVFGWRVLQPPPGPPDTEILDQPEAVTPSTEVAFVYRSTTAGVIFECALDAAPWGSCEGLPLVGVGVHVFAVRAVNAGTPDPHPPVYRWTVVAPDTLIDSTPASPTTSSGAVFTFHATTNPATFLCSRDGADFTACVSGQILTGLGVGLHHFEVRARNAAGDVDPTPAVAEWHVVAPAGAAPVGGAANGDAAPPAAPRPTLNSTPNAPTPPKATDPCARKTPRAHKVCQADVTLKRALSRCTRLKGVKRSRCIKKARAVRRCASLSGRQERRCRTQAAKLRGS